MGLFEDICTAIFKIICCEDNNDGLALPPVTTTCGGPTKLVSPFPSMTPSIRRQAHTSLHSAWGPGVDYDTMRSYRSAPTFVGHERQYPAINIGSGGHMIRIPSGNMFL